MFHGLLDVHASSPSPGGRAKVDVPTSVSDLNQTPTVEWYVVRCGSKDRYQKDVSKRDWITCSKYDNHSRLNKQHNWVDL